MQTPLEKLKATLPPGETTIRPLGGGVISVEREPQQKRIDAKDVASILSSIADRGKTCAIVPVKSLPLLREKYRLLLPDVAFDSLAGVSVFTYQSEQEHKELREGLVANGKEVIQIG